MSIRMHLGYWTVFSGTQAVLACESFNRAWTLVYETSQQMRRAHDHPPTQTRE